jgi:hypothetical protein
LRSATVEDLELKNLGFLVGIFRRLAAYGLPGGKHLDILTILQTKVNKKRPKIAKILAVSGHPEPLYYIGIQRWKSVSENVKWKRQIIIG